MAKKQKAAAPPADLPFLPKKIKKKGFYPLADPLGAPVKITDTMDGNYEMPEEELDNYRKEVSRRKAEHREEKAKRKEEHELEQQERKKEKDEAEAREKEEKEKKPKKAQ
jgi:peptide subunit release factor RF-3